MDKPERYTPEVEKFIKGLRDDRSVHAGEVPLCLYVEYGMSRSTAAQCFKYWKETNK